MRQSYHWDTTKRPQKSISGLERQQKLRKANSHIYEARVYKGRRKTSLIRLSRLKLWSVFLFTRPKRKDGRDYFALWSDPMKLKKVLRFDVELLLKGQNVSSSRDLE